MKVIFITGTIGSGKTTLLIALLKWLQSIGVPVPPVVVNDKGTGSNLDFARVCEDVPDVEARDFLGQCIGCGGQEQFVSLVNQLAQAGQKLLLVEPTGLFTLGELNKIADRIPGCSFRSVHLIPATAIQAATSISGGNLRLCRLIGLTRGEQNLTTQASMLEQAVQKEVLIIPKDPADNVLSGIWEALMRDDEDHHNGCDHHHNHQEEPVSCGHSHSHSHGHHHHHDGQPVCTTFDTEGWSYTQLLGYLLSVEGMVRFKGVVLQDDGTRLQVEWAHGRWTQQPVGSESPLKADLFTEEPIDYPDPVALTDQMIDTLIQGIAPVLVKDSQGGHSFLDPVGPTAWSLLYDASKVASDDVRTACGQQLVSRCREVALYLSGESLDVLDPQLIDYVRLQTSMVWLWWNQEFEFPLEEADRYLINQLLQALNPDNVDANALKPWMGQKYGYLPRLQNQFPDWDTKIGQIEEMMSLI